VAERIATHVPAAVTAEIRKLAHTLGVSAERLEHLGGVPAHDLRQLRGQIAEALFQADRALFSKVAALSKAVPVGVAAKLAQVAFSPLLAARTAEVIDPHRAGALVAKLPDGYLADVSAALDPTRAPHVVADIPPERIARVGAELARRREWVVIAAFVDAVSADALAATVAVFDGEQLLRIGFVLDDKSRLEDITGLVTDRQLDEMLAGAADHGLWQELDDLVGHLGPQRAQRLAARYRSAPGQVRAAVEEAAAAGSLSRGAMAALSGDG
jgi:hypothetical protein